MNNQDILDRVDKVIKENNVWLYLFAALTIILFLLGIAGIIYALVKGELIWTLPSTFTTLFLIWPIKQVKQIWARNVALATVPALITTLPSAQAAKCMQQLIEKLYDK